MTYDNYHRKCSLVCEKCGFRTKTFDPENPDNTGEYEAWHVEMKKHCDEKHPMSPRFHNYVHPEFWSDYRKEWYR